MKIPDLFKQVIADTFYDKDIEIWLSETIKDDEGAVIEDEKQKKIDSFKGNFQFTTREYIQKVYGLEVEANAIVTCDKTLAKIGDILVYSGNDYEIKSKIIGDSHTVLLVNGSDENV